MSDENRECYVTITAVPPITHCSVCHAADVAHPGSKCLKHSFTVHTKYELAPPFPVFSPRVHLKADRIAVFNTGDSLVAFAVDFPNSEPQQTQNPEVVKQCDVESIVHSKPANVVRSSVIGQHMYGTSMSLGKCIVSASPCDMKEPKRGDANCRDMSVYVFSSESEENTPVSSPLQPYEAAESPTSGLCQTCGHNRQAKPLTARGVNCECMQQKQSRNGAGNYDKLSPCLTQRINLKLPPDSPSCRSPTSPLSPPTLSSINTYSKFNENTPENVRTVQSSQRSFFSPSISESGSIASRSTDSVLFHVNESHCVTYSVRKFSHLEGSTESPILMEDDLDLAYRSILPADVHGIDNKPMHLIKSGPSDSWELSVVQLTLDIEHCLEETIRSSAEWGPRYVMFTNYDLQILDVCPVLECILVKAFVLLRAREETTIDKKQKRSKSCVKMYQTSIVFQWDWTSGVCDSVHIEDLSEINEADTRRQKWNPGHKELARLRKETFIPQTFQKSVYVLTNEAVFKGESLKILLAPQVYLAILL